MALMWRIVFYLVCLVSRGKAPRELVFRSLYALPGIKWCIAMNHIWNPYVVFSTWQVDETKIILSVWLWYASTRAPSKNIECSVHWRYFVLLKLQSSRRNHWRNCELRGFMISLFSKPSFVLRHLKNTTFSYFAALLRFLLSLFLFLCALHFHFYFHLVMFCTHFIVWVIHDFTTVQCPPWIR